MGVQAPIPVFDFSLEDLTKLGPKVREACEVHGCFLLRCNESDLLRLSDKMFEGMRSLFDLPDDIKRRYTSPTPFNSYSSKEASRLPLLESFGIDDAHLLESSQAFTDIIWPQGNPEFCSVLNGMSSSMLQLNLTMLMVICESYGAGSCYEHFAANNSTIFRLMKYHAPSSGPQAGLAPHADKNTLTILCQNDVQGLEVMSKDGVWTQLIVPHGCFVVLVGESLKAWSNGRLHAVKHKLTMSGNKDRYSVGCFMIPKDRVLVEVHKEFVDNEHPMMYNPFTYKDFISYMIESDNLEDTLQVYAGV